MYITIENIIGEKTVYLPYPLGGSKEIAIVELFQDNVTYELITDLEFALSIGENGGIQSKVTVPKKLYTSRELNSYLAGGVKLDPISYHPKVIKLNKLANIMKLNFILNELDNTENLLASGAETHLAGKLSNILLSYNLNDYGDTSQLEPTNPRYKKLRNGVIQSLTLTITDQNGKQIEDSLGTTVVLHVR